MATLLVLQHVPHEGLGTLAGPLAAAGCTVSTLTVSAPRVRWPDVQAFDGLIVMGGPMGVYQQDRYAFLTREFELLRTALKSKLPILGICLGAQLLAHALGADVRPNGQKEIGWYPLRREPGAVGDPLFETFETTETVFQWHGDTFSLPRGAVHLASSPLCAQQAFRYGETVYGLQFHVEVTETMIRAWLQHAGNRKELAALRGVVDPVTIRRQIPQHLDRLTVLARRVAGAFARMVTGRTAHAV